MASSTSTSTVAKQVLFALPPLLKDDQSVILETIQNKVPGYQESHLEAWKARQCLSEEDTKNAARTPFAESLLHELQTQIDKQYGSSLQQQQGQMSARLSVVKAAGAKSSHNNLVIRTYVELSEPLKFRAGYWSNEWTYENNRLSSGKISMQVHYYEDGTNVQLRGTREIPAAMSLSSSSSSSSTEDAAAVVQHMQRAALQFYNDLHEEIIGTSESGKCVSALKKVRRILPVTKTRMKWDDAAQEQIRLLNDSKAQKPKKKKSPTKK